MNDPPNVCGRAHGRSGTADVQRRRIRRAIEIDHIARIVRLDDRRAEPAREVVELVDVPVRVRHTATDDGQAMRQRIWQFGPRMRNADEQRRRAAMELVDVHSIGSFKSVLARAGDRFLVARVGMAHDAGRRIVPQHALDALRRRRRCRRRRSRRRRAASSPCRRRRHGAARPRSRRRRC